MRCYLGPDRVAEPDERASLAKICWKQCQRSLAEQAGENRFRQIIPDLVESEASRLSLCIASFVPESTEVLIAISDRDFVEWCGARCVSLTDQCAEGDRD